MKRGVSPSVRAITRQDIEGRIYRAGQALLETPDGQKTVVGFMGKMFSEGGRLVNATQPKSDFLDQAKVPVLDVLGCHFGRGSVGERAAKQAVLSAATEIMYKDYDWSVGDDAPQSMKERLAENRLQAWCAESVQEFGDQLFGALKGQRVSGHLSSVPTGPDLGASQLKSSDFDLGA